MMIVVLGSSVAAGTGATRQSQGWVSLLDAALRERYGSSVTNMARGGSDTERCLEAIDLIGDVAPDVTVVSLSLANEGILKARTPEDCEMVATQFRDGLSEIKGALLDKYPNTRLIWGGVYPNGGFTPMHTNTLYRVHDHMMTSTAFPEPVLPFLNLDHDHSGHWPQDMFHDSSHPNTNGHRAMFDQINLDLFGPPPS